MEFLDFFHVVLDHDLDEVFETGLLWVPSEETLGLARVAQQLVNFRRTEVLGVYPVSTLIISGSK